MRFLADECLDGRLVEGLRRAGNDVLAVRDAWRGVGDRAILEGARRERRALVTEDKGFGELVVRRGFSVPGLCWRDTLRVTCGRCWRGCSLW